MRRDHEKATELRRSGKSYKEISRELNIPLGTISGWFKDLDWSIEIRDNLARFSSFSSPEKLRILAETNRKRWEDKREKYRQDAIKQFTKLKNEALFLAGLMLYWGEGDKSMKYSRVRLANSDPGMIKIFYLFLQKLNIPERKIRVWLLLYPDLIDSVQKKFWSTATGISSEHFNNSIFIQGRHPTRRLSYGVCNLEVYSRELKEKIMKWLELYQNYFLSKGIENNRKLI